MFLKKIKFSTSKHNKFMVIYFVHRESITCMKVLPPTRLTFTKKYIYVNIHTILR